MSGDSVADQVGAIVNVGKTAWDIVRDGRASSSAASSYCSAVPSKIPFTDLYGWTKKSGVWPYVVENPLGMTLVECEFKYSFLWGGRSDDHPDAQFVKNFSVWCTSTDVFWGIDFDANATVRGSPYNAGNRTRVIGAIPILVRAGVRGSAAISNTWELTARGDGKLSTA